MANKRARVFVLLAIKRQMDNKQHAVKKTKSDVNSVVFWFD